MRLYKNRHLVSPLLFIYRKNDWGILYSSDTINLFSISFNSFSITLRPIDKMGGTCKTTSIYLDIKTKKNKYQLSLCWRPGVTYYHLIEYPNRSNHIEKEINDYFWYSSWVYGSKA